MEAMALKGGGPFYNVTNPHVLPRVFAKAVRVARTPMIREAPFTPVVLPTGSPLTLGLGPTPELGGLTLTQPRGEPTITNAMVTPEGEPVLAHWNVELGQVVAFTSDAHRWASAWIAWPGYARLWTQIVRQASRVPASRTLQPTSQIIGDEMLVRLEASEDDGRPADGLGVPATIYTPSGERLDIQLAQAGPGLYEARVPVSQTGSYVALMKPARDSRKLTPVIAGATLAAGSEYKALRSNDALLDRIAAAGGGKVVELSEASRREWFDRAGVPPQIAVTPVWPSLLAAALLVFLLDVGTRRVAWDRYRLREGVQTLAGVATQTGGLRVAKRKVDDAASGSGLALSEADAEKLRQAARDRRREARLAAAAPPVIPTESAPPAGDARGEEPSALLAAKRRAREQFKDES
jgi:Ca-activated chloride channel family protein